MNTTLKIKNIEFILIIIFMILASIGSFPQVTKKPMLILISLYFCFKMIRNSKNIKIKWSKYSLLFLFILFCQVSAFWSQYTYLSTKSSFVYLLLPAITMIYISEKYSYKEFLLLFFTTGLIMAMLSYIYVIIFPNEGISSFGEWRGIFEHKNNLGFSMALYCVFNMVASGVYVNYKYKLIFLFTGVIEIVLVLKSQSGNAKAVLFVGIFLYILLSVYKKIGSNILRIGISMIAVPLGVFTTALVFSNANTIFSVLGKDATFTGRTYIWEAVIELIKAHWLLGYGFDTPWIDGSPTKEFVATFVGIIIPHAHNNYLDVVLNVGVIGAGILVILILTYLVKGFRLLRKNRFNYIYYAPIIFVVILLVHEINESYFIRPSTISLMWCLFVYYYASFIKEYKEKV